MKLKFFIAILSMLLVIGTCEAKRVNKPNNQKAFYPKAKKKVKHRYHRPLGQRIKIFVLKLRG